LTIDDSIQEAGMRGSRPLEINMSAIRVAGIGGTLWELKMEK
jgi:hypothetical protein